MSRMGHDSMRAALIYQHTTTQKADRRIADSLERLLDEHATGSERTDHDPDEGLADVLVPTG